MAGFIVFTILVLFLIILFIYMFDINFLYSKPKIIKWQDGTFSVVKKYIGLFPKYLSANGYWWSSQYDIDYYCKFDTVEQAKRARNKLQVSYTVVE